MIRSCAIGTDLGHTSENFMELIYCGGELCLLTHLLALTGMDKSSYSAVFQMVKMRGVSFDLFSNLGCAFTFLDVFHGLFTILAVERRPSG
eukprot:2014176-Amphidinium_carterae.1